MIIFPSSGWTHWLCRFSPPALLLTGVYTITARPNLSSTRSMFGGDSNKRWFKVKYTEEAGENSELALCYFKNQSTRRPAT